MDGAVSEFTAVPIGTASCPSGVLLAIDLGALGRWSAETDPVATEHLHCFEITGIDAEAVALAAQATGVFRGQSATWFYDIPTDDVRRLVKDFDRLRAEGEFDAILSEEPWVPHPIRARRIAEHGGGVFHVRSTAIAALPTPPGASVPVALVMHENRPLAVRLALADGEGVDPDMRADLLIDTGVLTILDLTAATTWTEDTLDGQVDIMVRGHRVAAAAKKFDLTMLADDVAGATDLAESEAADRYRPIAAWASRRRVEALYLPHSDSYWLRHSIAESPRGTGMRLIGECTAVGVDTGSDRWWYPIGVVDYRAGIATDEPEPIDEPEPTDESIDRPAGTGADKPGEGSGGEMSACTAPPPRDDDAASGERVAGNRERSWPAELSVDIGL